MSIFGTVSFWKRSNFIVEDGKKVTNEYYDSLKESLKIIAQPESGFIAKE